MPEKRFRELEKDNRIWYGINGDCMPNQKIFLNNSSNTPPKTLWRFTEVGHTDGSKKALNKLFDGDIVFDFPKPVKLIKRILKLYTSPNDNDIILDFFSGSSTTAHAVMELNQEDGGNRKFILVQLPQIVNK